MAVSSTIRKTVLERDRYSCQRCGAEPRELSIHHIVTRKKHGGDNEENLITLCIGCHDWVEIEEANSPELRTRSGIQNSYPFHPGGRTIDWRQVGYRLPGDRIDIWEKWVKDGRRGAAVLIAKYRAIPDGNTIDWHTEGLAL